LPTILPPSTSSFSAAPTANDCRSSTNARRSLYRPFTAVAAGDYWAGPSHTLPTRQTSKYFSAVTSNDFVKSTSVIEYSQEQLAAAADDIIRLAMTEGLDAHAKSVQRRLE
jgi:histidinol dehydrogenase